MIDRCHSFHFGKKQEARGREGEIKEGVAWCGVAGPEDTYDTANECAGACVALRCLVWKDREKGVAEWINQLAN